MLSICSESPQCQGGDVSELCLNFVATDGEGKEVPLLPNGQEMPVTVENRVRYIYLLLAFPSISSGPMGKG